jgi:hypothetical protein
MYVKGNFNDNLKDGRSTTFKIKNNLIKEIDKWLVKIN